VANERKVRAAQTLNDARVLVVEDDFLLLTELESILQEAGAASVRTCRTMDEALALVEQESFTAAVLDVRIGHDSIAPLARRLQSCGTPFLFYTGQVSNDRIMAEWPKSRIVSKPAQHDVLVKAVAELSKDHLQQRQAGS
jgi:DNA-binding NtrC family response regulator